MAKIVASSIVIALVIATAVFFAAVTPLAERPLLFQVARAICVLDWPISRLTNRVDMSWQGLALFADRQGSRGIAPDMLHVFTMQVVWTVLVYTPLFVVVGALVRRHRNNAP